MDPVVSCIAPQCTSEYNHGMARRSLKPCFTVPRWAGSENRGRCWLRDIHNAYHQHLDGRTLFNTGSVGNPLEMPEASYVILMESMTAKIRLLLNIQFIRVPYPIEQAVQDALNPACLP